MKTISWERIDLCTDRACVFGGWLVRTWNDNTASALALTFVPDPEHRWAVVDVPEQGDAYDYKPGMQR